MAKLKKRFVLELTAEEVEWLRDYLQNARQVTKMAFELETDKDNDMRARMFGSLQRSKSKLR